MAAVLGVLSNTPVRAISVNADHVCLAGVISSVGLHTDDEFKAFTPAEGYNKNVTYKNGNSFWLDNEQPLHLRAMTLSAHSIQSI